MINLPHSCKYPYEADNWKNTAAKIQELHDSPSIQSLLVTIKRFISIFSTGDVCIDHINLAHLRTVIWERSEFIFNTLPLVCVISLRIEEFFPTGCIEVLQCNEVLVLNQSQVCCLLSHQFFCTFIPNWQLCSKYSGLFVGELSEYAPLTFHFWHQYNSDNDVSTVYLNALFNYFEAFFSVNSTVLEPISFHFYRHLETPDWKACNENLTHVEIFLNGKIGDEETVEICFSNSFIGFGPMATQEEAAFGVSPEMCPAVLFTPVLEERDCLVITGSKKFADFDGHSITCNGMGNDSLDNKERKVICIDAINLKKQKYVNEFSEASINRELNKALSGFLNAKDQCLGTGPWGCGEFNGNNQLKFLIQVLAASAAKVKQLNYYTFDDQLLFQSAKHFLYKLSHRTVGEIYCAMVDCNEMEVISSVLDSLTTEEA